MYGGTFARRAAPRCRASCVAVVLLSRRGRGRGAFGDFIAPRRCGDGDHGDDGELSNLASRNVATCVITKQRLSFERRGVVLCWGALLRRARSLRLLFAALCGPRVSTTTRADASQTTRACSPRARRRSSSTCRPCCAAATSRRPRSCGARRTNWTCKAKGKYGPSTHY